MSQAIEDDENDKLYLDQARRQGEVLIAFADGNLVEVQSIYDNSGRWQEITASHDFDFSGNEYRVTMRDKGARATKGDDMKTTLEKIEVMQAYADGQRIEFYNGKWQLWLSSEPAWNWGTNDYRIAQIPDTIDWSHFTDDVIAAARDHDGKKFLFTALPSKGASGWHPAFASSVFKASHLASYITGNTPWTESLLIRPGHERGCADGVRP